MTTDAEWFEQAAGIESGVAIGICRRPDRDEFQVWVTPQHEGQAVQTWMLYRPWATAKGVDVGRLCPLGVHPREWLRGLADQWISAGMAWNWESRRERGLPDVLVTDRDRSVFWIEVLQWSGAKFRTAVGWKWDAS